jgi:hypothetical protein
MQVVPLERIDPIMERKDIGKILFKPEVVSPASSSKLLRVPKLNIYCNIAAHTATNVRPSFTESSSASNANHLEEGEPDEGELYR